MHTEEEWKVAADHALTIKKQYDSMIMLKGNVTFALIHINRDLTEYANGARNEGLYKRLLDKS